MAKTLKIPSTSSEPILDIVDNTLKMNKQVIIFVNTKRGAESLAERISTKIKTSDAKLINLSEDMLKAVSTPTKQCRRIALCAKKGAAFHHAGLASKQRDLVEDGFRSGLVKVICATPTLAMGVDLPAFRVIVRDLKRYGGSWGMTDILVLEYEQQAGRAGRPGMEDYGEAICMATTLSQSEEIFTKYIKGDAEEIYSKLAVEPVLRTHILSLIASGFVNSRKSLFEFFDGTFYAHQYADLFKLHQVLEKVIGLLDDWEFIKTSSSANDFVSANEMSEISYKVTPIGSRVSEMYLDPLTADFIIKSLRRATSVKTGAFSYLQMIASTLEIRPVLRVRTSEFEEIQGKSLAFEGSLLVNEPSMFDESYENFLNTVKTALFFHDWIEEKNEEYLLEVYSVRPGELHAKLNIADWLFYATEELARLMKFQVLLKDISKVRARMKYGAKKEIMPLLKLKGIGRTRARKMFNNKLKNLADIKAVDITTLSQLIGKAISISIKKQLGQEYDPKKVQIKENKRKGQISLNDY